MQKKITRREQFLADMEAVVPWMRLQALIEPHYPKAGLRGGRPPMPLETMLRIYFLQNWYALSDPMADETQYDSEAMRWFAGIELGDDRIPAKITILNFRHLLQRHGLTEAIFADVKAHLHDKGITPCIPSRKNSQVPIPYDEVRYRKRHKIENSFSRLKDWRRVATRNDRCPKVFLSACALAAVVMFWL